jgi:uncharacterized membrane protein
MSTAYTIVKYIHIILAIVAVGFNSSYGIILAGAGKNKELLDFALRTIRVLDNRFANPAYAGLVISGLGMLHLGKISIKTHWVLGSLGLLAIMIPLAIVYARLTRKQLAALAAEGPDGAEYQRLGRINLMAGLAMFVMVFVILGFMVFKPHWG